jgi:hypothetical protein
VMGYKLFEVTAHEGSHGLTTRWLRKMGTGQCFDVFGCAGQFGYRGVSSVG